MDNRASQKMVSTLTLCCGFSVFSILYLTRTPVCGLSSDFTIYWNIPSFMCHRYDISFMNFTREFGIIQNVDDNFRGDKIAILYDPGEFPAILQNSSSGEYFYRNGGVPQQGNILQHLDLFEQHVNELIPDATFNGLAVIDFESWRPTYRQNFGALKPYKILSEKIERHAHPLWSDKRIQREAESRFEIYGRRYMEDTLYLGQKLRPNASWGYYGLPYCFNGRGNHVESCPTYVKKENSNLRWLFESVDIVFPSVYMSEHILPKNRVPMVLGRVDEALRLIKRLPSALRPEVLVYHRFVYADSLKYVTEVDTYGIFSAIQKVGADGIILWGSSSDLNTSYLNNVLAPVINSLLPVYSIKPIQ